MGKATNAETLSVHAPKSVVRLITARGDAIGQKKSKFASLVLQWWVAQGAPAVNKIDDTMRAEVMASLEEKPTQKRKAA